MSKPRPEPSLQLDTSTNLHRPAVTATKERVQDGSEVETLAERW